MRRLVCALLAIGIAFPSGSAQAAISDSDLYWLDDYGFSKAWSLSRGEGVRVAVIDTGIDTTHPALKDAVVGGIDVSGLGNSNGTKPVGQSSYHGTMVASLLAARSVNGSAVTGVAPAAEILSVSVAFGINELDTDKQIADGMIWAVDNGAKVINLSLTRNTSSWPKVWDKAFSYAFENDVVVVAAVGNRGDGTEEISAPATIPGVISVAGLDRDGTASNISSVSGFSIAVTAPAEDLIAAFPGGEYRIWSGTSGAAPIVSGLVALIRSRYPNLDAANVINRVIQSAGKKGFDGYSTSYGYGVINAELALKGDYSLVDQNPLGSLNEWIELYREEEGDSQGALVPPLELEPEVPETLNADAINQSPWLPIALYAGVGLFGLFIYFSFRPQRRGESSNT